MWKKGKNNYTEKEIINYILKYEAYFSSEGGITFSGGEPLLYSNELLSLFKKIKKHNINIAIETSGVGNGYKRLLKYIDLIILDIKSYDKAMYKYITGNNIDIMLNFIKDIQKKNKQLWIRQVIVPGINDNKEYVLGLKEFCKNIKNVKKIELLPYHTMAIDKYKKLNIKYQFQDIKGMNQKKCDQLQNLLK